MTNKEIADQLRRLAQLDTDAIHAYDRAIKAIDVFGVKDKLGEFKLDHQRHVLDLSKAMHGLGESPPAFSADFKGFVIQGFTALRSMTGTEGALKAMRGNEQLTNAVYAGALAKPLPESVLEIVRRNYGDEQRHLAWIEKTLQDRAWEGAGAHA